MSVRLRLAGLAVATLALVTACGSGGGTGNKVATISDPAKPSNQQQASDNRSDEDKIRDFTKCMKEHGVDIPEPSSAPKAGGSGGGGSAGIVVQGNGPDKEKIDKANEACRALLPNGGKPPKLDAKQLDEMRKMAQCMREHGINMPDPDPNNPGIALGPDSGVDPDAMEKASKECAPAGAEIHTQQDGGPGGGSSGPETHADTGSGNR